MLTELQELLRAVLAEKPHKETQLQELCTLHAVLSQTVPQLFRASFDIRLASCRILMSVSSGGMGLKWL